MKKASLVLALGGALAWASVGGGEARSAEPRQTRFQGQARLARLQGQPTLAPVEGPGAALLPTPASEYTVSEGYPTGMAPAEYPYTTEWHAGFARTGHDRPWAILVPPNCYYQTTYNWGTASTQIGPIVPQFVGPQMGYPYDNARYYTPTPYWPNDTRQFGVYYIRGPW